MDELNARCLQILHGFVHVVRRQRERHHRVGPELADVGGLCFVKKKGDTFVLQFHRQRRQILREFKTQHLTVSVFGVIQVTDIHIHEPYPRHHLNSLVHDFHRYNLSERPLYRPLFFGIVQVLKEPQTVAPGVGKCPPLDGNLRT